MTIKEFNEKLNDNVRRSQQDKYDKFEEFLLDMEASFDTHPAENDHQRGYKDATTDILDYWQRLGLGVFNHNEG